jgi:hypothetical protein
MMYPNVLPSGWGHEHRRKFVLGRRTHGDGSFIPISDHARTRPLNLPDETPGRNVDFHVATVSILAVERRQPGGGLNGVVALVVAVAPTNDDVRTWYAASVQP